MSHAQCSWLDRILFLLPHSTPSLLNGSISCNPQHGLLFDNDTVASFFLADYSILLRHMNGMVDTSPHKCPPQRAIREVDNQVNQHIEIQHTDKVADESVAVQRQVSPRTTETKAPEYQWDDRPGGDARQGRPRRSSAGQKGRIR